MKFFTIRTWQLQRWITKAFGNYRTRQRWATKAFVVLPRHLVTTALNMESLRFGTIHLQRE